MKRVLLAVGFLLWQVAVIAQSNSSMVTLQVTTDKGTFLSKATVELLRGTDTSLVKFSLSDSNGLARFQGLPPGLYCVRTSYIGYQTALSPLFKIEENSHHSSSIRLSPQAHTLQTVTVAAPHVFMETQMGKTTVNIAGSTTQIGSNAWEMLEKLPGVSLDKNGQISLKGRKGVLVLIDGKPTYLDAAALSNLLSTINTAQISQVEIMDQPSAKYDASGNAGVINIKTKKIRQRGFTGSLTSSFSQGRYWKTNQNVQLSYRTGKLNFITNYSFYVGNNFSRIEALRTYFKEATSIASILEHPTFLKSQSLSHTLQTGMDYFLTPKTTLSLVFSGNGITRTSEGWNNAAWKQSNGHVDSLVLTQINNKNSQHHKGITASLQHQFSKAAQLAADMDAIRFHIEGQPQYSHIRTYPTEESGASKGHIPSQIDIVAAKVDYSQQVKQVRLETGWKSAYISTDNHATYQYQDNSGWQDDYNRTSRFRYNETIHAWYSFSSWKHRKWNAQGGLRYEWTLYQGEQRGNAQRKDSSFAKNYHSLFPSAVLTWQADSLHALSVSASRRIDRPAYQKLNPFLFIINKYAFHQGNPFLQPQFTWNLSLTHSYKEIFSTTLSYSHTQDYISQFFFPDANGVMIYTDGNLGAMHNLGITATVQLSPASWWSLAAQTSVNQKRITGVLWKTLEAKRIQGTVSVQNQFRFEKGWGAEITGFYNSRSQQDIQEIVEPSGQVSVGISKALWKNKATIKGAFRDIFYTQDMQGVTQFEQAEEFFRMSRDTRTITLAMSYRFGKPGKASRRRQSSSAADELQRAGN